MTHELFGLPVRMHDVMNLALLDAALIIALPFVLVAVLRWTQKHDERKRAKGDAGRNNLRSQRTRRKRVV